MSGIVRSAVRYTHMSKVYIESVVSKKFLEKLCELMWHYDAPIDTVFVQDFNPVETIAEKHGKSFIYDSNFGTIKLRQWKRK